MCMNVDLPDPDGPVTAMNSPRSTSRFTPRSAFTSTSPTTYVLTRLLTAMTIGMDLPAPPAAAAGPARSAALVGHQRVAGARGRRVRPRVAEEDAGHDFHVLLELAAQQLRVRTVSDPQAEVH